MPRAATPTKTAPPAADPWVTLEELLEELKGISERTFREWRAKGRGPVGKMLPNGKLRFRRSAIDKWLANLPDA